MGEMARFRCLCGRIHTLDRQIVLDRLAQDQWRCTHCGRKFVLMQEGPSAFCPVFISGDTRPAEAFETGPGEAPPLSSRPEPPPAIEFRCRCGQRMLAHSWMYGSYSDCMACRTPLLLALRFDARRNWYLIVPEYPTDTALLRAQTEAPTSPAPPPAARTARPAAGTRGAPGPAAGPAAPRRAPPPKS